uniref:Predicted 3'-5' exonuclease PolB-like domain-containing protein n=1 Tax=Candidatus Kentrum eta TaxID=2126337 RepID=A0A450V2X1_9GAMM|nr:MAG: hypothetical protein BECKH772A_GA0070896_101499 [Candidatus Kentron sp. H]VFJ99160.1 MAG: hypothetical protein BECKH772B_GA0070898_101519 [Candidatus Kentron sp. H]VFK03806.1 MAG: hypothetical protein BECKH772C_GA0070978_101463 [Candidatus Kentron sp. H]
MWVNTTSSFLTFHSQRNSTHALKTGFTQSVHLKIFIEENYMNVLAFDIETVPDVENGRRLLNLHDLDDRQIAEVMFHHRRQETGTEFLRHDLHRVVAISAVFRSDTRFKVGSFGDEKSSEKGLIQRFFDGVGRSSPVLVSWNGGRFDLPVLHYRSLLHGVSAPRYWDMGEFDKNLRWNNYLNRFHYRHTDLMDVLSGYQMRAAVPLDGMAGLLGFPGKLGMDGAKVWEKYLAGDVKAIRNYCETDVLNTYLVYLRFQLVRGHLTQSEHDRECQRVRDELASSEEAHLQEFLAAWTPSNSSPKGPPVENSD